MFLPSEKLIPKHSRNKWYPRTQWGLHCSCCIYWRSHQRGINLAKIDRIIFLWDLKPVREHFFLSLHVFIGQKTYRTGAVAQWQRLCAFWISTLLSPGGWLPTTAKPGLGQIYMKAMHCRLRCKRLCCSSSRTQTSDHL